jgi:hypothetical protein
MHALLLVIAVHHGIVNFDLNKDLSLTGTVTRVDFVNPHSWLHLEVKDANGKPARWRCEMRANTVLRRSGWTPQMFKVGSTVTVTGSPDRVAPNTCYLGTVRFADGSSMDRYGQRQVRAVSNVAPRAPRLANGNPNIAGDWAAEQRVMTDPRGISGALLPLSEASKLKPGEVPEGQRAFPGARGTPASLAKDPVQVAWVRPSPVELTDAGKRAVQNLDFSTTDNPRLRCKPTNILFDWTFDTMVNRIEQSPQRITLRYGFMDITRTIHLDQAAHPANLKPSVAGHSIGKWENDVLVVDTVGFAPGVLSADARTMHSAQLHVVERFSFDAQKKALTRAYVAEDPLYFSGQYKGSDTMYPAEVAYGPYKCEDSSAGSIGDPQKKKAAPSPR